MDASDTGLPLAKGTAVSARFKGAFCEATIKDVCCSALFFSVIVQFTLY